jgi:WD40 repeat protein
MPINNVAYSYDGKYIASCSDDKTIKIWSTDLTTKEPIMTLLGHEAPVLTALYSFDSKKLVSSDQNGVVKVWNMPQGQLIRTINAHKELVQDVSFAEDNKTIVTGSLDKKVKLFDSETGKELMSFDAGVEVWSVDLISDASVIILGCADGSVRFLVKQ